MSMSDTNNNAIDALRGVQTSVRDAINGYETMLEKAEPSFKKLVEHIRALHRRHDQELVALLSASGEAEDTSGSLMSAVHQSVVTIRSWFGEIDHALIPQIIDGELRLVDAYQGALAAGPTKLVAAALERQRDEINGMIAEFPQRAP